MRKCASVSVSVSVKWVSSSSQKCMRGMEHMQSHCRCELQRKVKQEIRK